MENTEFHKFVIQNQNKSFVEETYSIDQESVNLIEDSKFGKVLFVYIKNNKISLI